MTQTTHRTNQRHARPVDESAWRRCLHGGHACSCRARWARCRSASFWPWARIRPCRLAHRCCRWPCSVLPGSPNPLSCPSRAGCAAPWWPPRPYPALLHSSTMVKAGVYLVLRLAPAYVGTMLSPMIALAGLFTFVATSALAVGQSKRQKNSCLLHHCQPRPDHRLRRHRHPGRHHGRHAAADIPRYFQGPHVPLRGQHRTAYRFARH